MQVGDAHILSISMSIPLTMGSPSYFPHPRHPTIPVGPRHWEMMGLGTAQPGLAKQAGGRNFEHGIIQNHSTEGRESS